MIPDWVFLRRAVLLDANLLVILVAGLTDEQLLGESLGEYGPEDFRLILNIVRASRRAFVTPYILAEVNSLLNRTGYARGACRSVLCETILPLFEEHYKSGLELANDHGEFVRTFGLTDVSILEAVTDDIFVLTADGPLCGKLRGMGKAALHYEEIRFIAQALRS